MDYDFVVDRIRYRIYNYHAIVVEVLDKSGLQHVEIPSFVNGTKVVMINQDVFRCCPELISVKLPTTLEDIGMSAFACCPKLKTVTQDIGGIPLRIENTAFAECESLTTFDADISEIGSGAFSGCKELFSFQTSSFCNKIKGYAFSDCTKLTKIGIKHQGKNVLPIWIDHTAFFNTNLKKVFIGCDINVCGDVSELFPPNAEIYCITDSNANDLGYYGFVTHQFTIR